MKSTTVKSEERVKDLSVRDKSSHMYKHFIKKNHLTVKRQDFEISSKGFRQRKIKKKISETFLIKENKCSLKSQKKNQFP